MDVLTRKQRGYCMPRIKGADTTPELIVRATLCSQGIRNYRLKSNVPGRPDIYFPHARIAVFIDGCFWHGCPECYIKPKNNAGFWSRKRRQNLLRDIRVSKELRMKKIRMLRFWEHQIRKSPEICCRRVIRALTASSVKQGK